MEVLFQSQVFLETQVVVPSQATRRFLADDKELEDGDYQITEDNVGCYKWVAVQFDI